MFNLEQTIIEWKKTLRRKGFLKDFRD